MNFQCKTDYSEEPVYDISSLFADVGGAAGLALGMSLATLIGEYLAFVGVMNSYILGAIEYIFFKLIDVIKRKIINFASWLCEITSEFSNHPFFNQQQALKFLNSDPNKVIHTETQF